MHHLRKTNVAKTIRWKVTILTGELKRHGAVVEVSKRDLPRSTTRERSVYRPEILEKLFAACTPEEHLVYQHFLLTGMREQEVANFSESGIDAKRCTVRVVSRPELGFEPKSYEERSIRVPRRHIEQLMAHCATHANSAGLVFATQCAKGRPQTGGQRDKKLLLKLKALAHRAGLNCGRCKATMHNKPVTCATHPVCKQFGLHKFRHTFATMMLRDGCDLPSLQRMMGHKDLETTSIYLHALEADQMEELVESSSLSRIGVRAAAESTPQMVA